ncbi:A-kinase-interacting protein 1 isoform X1 [Rhinoderma darwinii]|uniref:A-kinase-interacting protein 1 isoform X1 n=1 Tax=Rhinoderma darwinii TaxID=43563 RepID=UPI003F672804
MYGAVTVSRVVRWLRVLYLTGSRTFHLVVCRSHTMEESHMWMEDSLRRTSEIGREVLERARRRDVDWWSAGTPGDRSPRTHPRVETPEEEERPSSLEDAFSTLSRFMRQTTEQCESPLLGTRHPGTWDEEGFQRSCCHRSDIYPISCERTPAVWRSGYMSPAAAPGSCGMFTAVISFFYTLTQYKNLYRPIISHGSETDEFSKAPTLLSRHGAVCIIDL